MKKILLIPLFAFALILSGCGTKDKTPANQTPADTNPAPQQTPGDEYRNLPPMPATPSAAIDSEIQEIDAAGWENQTMEEDLSDQSLGIEQ